MTVARIDLGRTPEASGRGVDDEVQLAVTQLIPRAGEVEGGPLQLPEARTSP